MLCDLFILAEYAEEIPAHDFADVGVTVAHVDQAFDEDWIFGDVFHAGGSHAGDAVEIGAEADGVDTGDFGDVVDVFQQFGVADLGHFFEVLLLDGADGGPIDGLLLGDRLDLGVAGGAVVEVDAVGGFVEVAGVEVDADDAAAFADCLYHVVGHVADDGGDGEGGGVAGDDG